jgi:FAD binding domain
LEGDKSATPKAKSPLYGRKTKAGVNPQFGGEVMAYVRDHVTDPRRIDYRPMNAFLLPAPWYRGRVLVIGEAAHTTTPHLATGGGIAIEDAVVLAELLATGLTVPELLGQFMTRRFARCRPCRRRCSPSPTRRSSEIRHCLRHGHAPDVAAEMAAFQVLCGDTGGRGFDRSRRFPSRYGSSDISFWNSDCGQARAVRVRTFPCAPSASANLATLSPLGVSTMTRRSSSPDVR